MALVVKDRVQETSSTTGTGTLTLDGAVTGFQTFSTAIGNANTTYYTIQNDNEWEVGVGTVGAGTLSRDTVLESSNGGSLVNLSSGAKLVFCTYPAEKSVDVETAQTLTNKTISVDNNTLSGIVASSFVVSDAFGNIDGTALQKVIPSGDVVGTVDSQTLTNKSISGSSNTVTNIPNSSLVNSSITINGSPVSLGGSTTINPIPSGTRLAFQQTSAPTGWTKDTTAALNDSVMRIVTGTVSSGGANAFSTFNGQSSVGATTLTSNQIPAHTHTLRIAGGNTGIGTTYGGGIGYAVNAVTTSTGGGGSHTHSLSVNIKYNDFIIASKD